MGPRKDAAEMISRGDKMMDDRQIEISEPNARVLRSLLRTRYGATHDQEHLDDLRAELERALMLDPSRLSPSVVTMHAAVRVRDLENGHRQELTLVSPSEANVSAGVRFKFNTREARAIKRREAEGGKTGADAIY